MRIVAICLLVVTLLVLGGCASREGASRDVSQTRQAQPAAPGSTSTAPNSGAAAEKSSAVQDGDMKKASLANAENSQGNVTITERKIIRNAELTVETTDPGAGQRRIASIAEARGGFVVTSESKQRNAEGQMKPDMIVTIQVRVPAAQFDAVVNEIRGSGNRVTEEKITGQDVTEEYIDLEARIRAKQALEAQFMEIMKQAKTVQDALEVQRQLSDVRAEIERLEGRRRFLENQSSLSTITVTLQPPTTIASTTGFFRSVKRAFSEGLDVAAAFTLGLISVVVALLPMFIFIVLPIFLLIRYLIRRAGRKAPAFQAPQQAPQPPPSAPQPD